MESNLRLKLLNIFSLCIVASFVGLSEAHAAPQSLHSFGTVESGSIDTWKSFRGAQPFQTQVIALSKPNTTEPRTLIISEPPPKVSWGQLAASLKAISHGCTVKRWNLMSGGWVQDVVCTLKDDGRGILPDRLAMLQKDMYGTTEGSAVVTLPVPKRAMIAHNLDLRYNASDLHRWLFEANQRFRANSIAQEVSLDDILKGSARGVFQNHDRTLVLWAFERASEITDFEAEFRRFAVGSDLILGAVASKKTVVVVGRGRVESLSHLPPLRGETVRLLAGSSEYTLRQSYERNDILAGTGSDGIDRAPILLSPQLVDTELGSLLNITDQLLKGWSMAGLVKYTNFNYPKPKTYPFGKFHAMEAEKDRKREAFLFNWNTDGAAYRQSIEGLEVVAPQRTGALSVIYGDPQDRPRDLENTAYDYFATSGDTSLVRVAQYTLLYQIFRQFDIHTTPSPISQRYEMFAASMKNATRRQLKLVLSDLSDEELSKRLRVYWKRLGEQIPYAFFSEVGTSREEFIEGNFKMAKAVSVEFRKGQTASDGKLSDALTEGVSLLRQRKQLTPSEQESLRSVMDAVNLLHKSGIMAVAAERLGTWTTLNSNTGLTLSWNNTAYVVESKGPSHLQGGHNINAPLIRFNESTVQVKGAISVSDDTGGQLVVTYNPSEANRLREITRQVGTRKEFTKDQIEAEVNAALKSIPPDSPVPFAAIRSESAIAAAKATEFKFLGASESIYRTRALTVDEKQLMFSLKATNEQAIVFEQLSDGSFNMIRTGGEEALQVASITAATDALANGLLVSAGGRAPVTVLIKGLPTDKAEAMLSQIQSSLRRYPKETVQQVLSSVQDNAQMVQRPTLLNARIAHNGIRVERGAVKVERVTSGVYKGYSRVEVPITIQAKTPLLLRLIFYVKDLTAASMELLLNKVVKLMATFKEPTSMADVNFVVRQQLQADLRELGVEAVLLRRESDSIGKIHDVDIAMDPARQVRAHVG